MSQVIRKVGASGVVEDWGGPGSSTPIGAPDRPRVSIPMVAFRHEAYVERAIQSVVDQDFEDWEIVLADDQSDDRTVEVARSCMERTMGPRGQRLRILPHAEKVWPRPNYIRAMQASRGDFVAQLDGDDFFVDPQKLSKQVAFLDAHPECSGVFGAWLETDGDGESGELTRGFGLEDRDRFESADFGPYCRTTSVVVMFRNRLFPEYPRWYMEADVGDWPLHVLNTWHGGPYAYIPDVLSAHRNHSAGVWSARSQAEVAESTIRTHDLYLRVLPDPLREAMLPQMVGANLARGRSALKRKEGGAARVFLDWCARHPQHVKHPVRLKLRRLRAGWLR